MFRCINRFGYFLLVWMLFAAGLQAAERVFDFDKVIPGQLPEGFVGDLAGTGKPGQWKIILDEVPSLLAPISANAPVPKRNVLAQSSRDVTDERFPVCVFDKDVYGDFTFTTRVKVAGGAIEQMAGIVFRYQDPRNFYVLRLSALDGTFRFYEVVNGVRGQLVGPKVDIVKGQWYQIEVRCKGNQIECKLDGKSLIPPLSNNAFTAGKVGFWSKSDSEAYFSEAKIVYIPREPLVTSVVRETLAKYPRIHGLKVFALPSGKGTQAFCVAAKESGSLGEKGTENDLEVIQHGKIFYGKGKSVVTVTVPFNDRNGEPMASLRITLDSFAGQTQQNAIARCLPIKKFMEERVGMAKDLVVE